MSYQDPENLEEIMDKIKNTPTIGGIKDLMEEIFSGLFITTMDSFCEDYPELNKNWEKVCKKAKTTTKHIIILDDYTDDCNLVNIFAECFTTVGFAVRRKSEFIPCEKCLKAIPAKSLHTFFKEKGVAVPEIWSQQCISCT